MNSFMFLPLVLLFNFSGAANLGSINIQINGRNQTKYVVTGESIRKYVEVTPSSITLTGGGHIYFGNSSSDDLTPSSYFLVPLLGNKFTFSVDLSQVGCSCNGALYAISMPAYNSSQHLVPGPNNDYYCDANKVGGTYCPEMDIMEANKYAMASTPHTCQLDPPHYYPSCDHGGCGTNILKINISEYGPGKTIDTNKPFTLSTAFIANEENVLTTIKNSFLQEGKTLQFDSCSDADYLQQMGKSLPGITMRMSLWGLGPGGMSWLDGKSGCHSGCNLSESKVTFSDFKLDRVQNRNIV